MSYAYIFSAKKKISEQLTDPLYIHRISAKDFILSERRRQRKS